MPRRPAAHCHVPPPRRQIALDDESERGLIVSSGHENDHLPSRPIRAFFHKPWLTSWLPRGILDVSSEPVGFYCRKSYFSSVWDHRMCETGPINGVCDAHGGCVPFTPRLLRSHRTEKEMTSGPITCVPPYLVCSGARAIPCSGTLRPCSSADELSHPGYISRGIAEARVDVHGDCGRKPSMHEIVRFGGL